MPAVGDIVYSVKSKRQNLYVVLKVEGDLATIEHTKSGEKYYKIPVSILRLAEEASFLCKYCHARKGGREQSTFTNVCVACFENLPSCVLCQQKMETPSRPIRLQGFPDLSQVCRACATDIRRCNECLIYHKGGLERCSSCEERQQYPMSRGARKGYDYTPAEFNFHKVNTADPTPYLGVELECANVLHLRDNDVVSWELQKESGGFLYSVFDSSINANRVGERDGDGIEVVSHPATFAWWKQHSDIVKLITRLKDQGFRSYNARLCGMHIHISRKSFEDTSHLARFLALFFSLYRFWTIVSEKDPAALKRYASGGSWATEDIMEVAKHTTTAVMGSRYKIVNVTSSTVEVRPLKGALNEEYFYKNLELVMAAFDFSSEDLLISEEEFVKFVMSNQKAYPLFFRFLISKMKEHTKKIQALLPDTNVSPIVLDKCA